MRSINQNFITEPYQNRNSAFHSPISRNKDFTVNSKKKLLDYFYEEKVVKEPVDPESYKNELRSQMREKENQKAMSRQKEKELEDLYERKVEEQRRKLKERYEIELLSASKNKEEEDKENIEGDDIADNTDKNDSEYYSVKNTQKNLNGTSKLSEFSYSINFPSKNPNDKNGNEDHKPFSVDKSKFRAKAIFQDSLKRSTLMTKDYMSAHKFQTKDILDRIGNIKAQNLQFNSHLQNGSNISDGSELSESVLVDSTNKRLDLRTNKNNQIFSNFKPSKTNNDDMDFKHTFTPKKNEDGRNERRVDSIFDTIDCSDIKDKIQRNSRAARGLKVLRLYD